MTRFDAVKDRLAWLLPRRRVPSILQMEAAECGAACLAMVLAHFGRDESLDAVRAACTASRDGVSAASLLRVAESFGLGGDAYTVDPEDLAHLPGPQILFWNFNHFVVLERVRGDTFTVIDPACGRRRIPAVEMSRSFTGLTLSFRTTPAFRPAPATGGLARMIGAVLRGSWATAIGILASTVLLTLAGILLPSITRIFVDEYLNQGRRDWLVPMLLAIGALAVLRAALTWMNVQMTLFAQTKIGAALSSRLVWTLLNLPYAFLSRRSAAEISTRMQLTGQLAGTATGPVLKIANSTVMLVGFGLVMLAYSPLLTGAVLVVLTANVMVLWAANRAVAETSGDAQMMAGRAHGIAMQGIALLEESRATGTVPLLFRRLVDAHIDEVNAQQRSVALSQRMAALPFFCNQFLALVVLGLGSYQVMRAEMTIGSLLAFQMLAQMFAAPLQGVIAAGSAILTVSGSVVRLRDLFEATPRDGAAPAPPRPEASGGTVERLRGHVSLEGLGFAYPGRDALFTDLSADFAPGTMTLVLGASGTGKTTLAMLLAGVLVPDSGAVHWDGQPADTVPADIFRMSVGLAEQAPFFAAGGLKDALSLWDPERETAQLAAALRVAELEDVVQARPGGLNGRIGEAGAGFSGGELQRLGLARALSASPSVLIVDDATTALDAVTERRVLDNLRALRITVIMLSSRAALASQFDTVLTLGEGRLTGSLQARAA